MLPLYAWTLSYANLGELVQIVAIVLAGDGLMEISKEQIGMMLACSIVGSWLLTAWVRKVALRENVVDVANERSMHQTPTPRGGGAGMAIVFVLACLAAFLFGWIGAHEAAGIGGGGLAVSLLGWFDDRYTLSSRLRLLVQFVISAGSVALFGGLTSIRVGVWSLDLGVYGSVLAVVGLVWFINLFNFMDGIDGLSGVEALMCGAALGAILWLSAQNGGAVMTWVWACAALGFLYWNWSPSKIFLGDVGSTLNGYVLGLTSLIAMQHGVGLFVCLLIQGAFFSDATMTLICRALNKEKIMEAHRSHAFQAAAIHYKSHALVSIGYGVVNLLFFFPLAFAAYFHPTFEPLIGLFGIGVSFVVVWWARGGVSGGGWPIKSVHDAKH